MMKVRYCSGLLSVTAALAMLMACASPTDPESAETSQEEPAAEEVTEEVDAGPNAATEVADALKAANLFPEANEVRTVALTEADLAAGAVAAANLASSRPEGVTIKVYASPQERNQARLGLIDECPGCNHLAECGPIIVVSPSATNTPEYERMSMAAKQTMNEINQGLNAKMREIAEALNRHYSCP